MSKNSALWLVWAGFILYIVLLAPPIQPDTATLLKNLFTLQWKEINPIILSLFSLVGIWLQIYSCLLFIDGRMQKLPFWSFILTSVATGVIGLLPYLALRKPNQAFAGEKDALLKLVDSRWTGMILAGSTILLLAYAIIAGDWGDFLHQFQTSRFINGMTLAFCLFCLLFPTVLGDDMARRGLKNYQVFWAVTLVPLLGAVAYLCLRPSLPEMDAGVVQSQEQPA